MGSPVPASDLPSGLAGTAVPADDLPGAPNPVVSAAPQSGGVMDWLTNGDDWKKAAIRAGSSIAQGPAGMVDLATAGPRLDKYLHEKLFGEPTPNQETLGGDISQLEEKYAPDPNQGLGMKAVEFGAGMLPLGNALGDLARAPQAAEDASGALTGLRGSEKALAGGKALGMRVTPGEKLDSTPLKQVEEWAKSHPWTSGPFAKIAKKNQTILNQTAAAELGEPGEKLLDSDVLGRVSDRLSEIFEKARTPDAHLPVTPGETDEFLNGLADRYDGLLTGDKSVTEQPLIRKLKEVTSRASVSGSGKELAVAGQAGAGKTGTVTAQELGQLSSKLGKRAYKEMSSGQGDRDLGQALYEAKDHVDDLLERHMTPEGKEAYATARKQYRRLLQFLKRGVVNPATGHVSGKSLANELARSDRSGYTFGKNESDLYKAARFSQAFKPIVGDSGTATRMSNPLVDIPMSVLGHAASSAYLNAPKVLGNPFVQAAGATAYGDLEPYLQDQEQ